MEDVNSVCDSQGTSPEDLDEEELPPFDYAMFEREFLYFVEHTMAGRRAMLVQDGVYTVNQVYVDFITHLKNRPNNRRDLVRANMKIVLIQRFMQNDNDRVFGEIIETLEKLDSGLQYSDEHMARVVDRAGNQFRSMKRALQREGL